MGNRAVISIGKTHSPANIGIYLHWNGGRDSIEPFLAATREVMKGRLGDESYGTARLIQCVTTFINGNLSCGVDICKNLDCDNGDNGTYVVDPATLQIIGREFHSGIEQNSHNHDNIKNLILERIAAGVEKDKETV